jgi:hypothetical protein
MCSAAATASAALRAVWNLFCDRRILRPLAWTIFVVILVLIPARDCSASLNAAPVTWCIQTEHHDGGPDQEQSLFLAVAVPFLRRFIQSIHFVDSVELFYSVDSVDAAPLTTSWKHA